MNENAGEFTIRTADPSDLDAIRAIYNGRLAARGTLQSPFAPEKLWKDRLESQQPGRTSLVACFGDAVVGHASIFSYQENPRRKHVGTIGMAVNDDWQGKGVGTALMAAMMDLADNWLNLHRVELEVYTDNEAGIRLYQKFGFEREGTLRDFAFRDGRYADVYAMARLRPER